ncbi:isoleucine--tRNA ligase [Fibrobacterales bacterium]|nr:isoleucine--tRNA ligase [Fibrobacterales bacterium]
MQFREQEKGEGFTSIENRVLELWDKDGSFEKSIENRKDGNSFSFYDGPPFATGLPHYGHLLAGTIKDIVPRYWTMKGRYVPRRFGWDCHGVPIESIIQNQLNLAGVDEIQKFGVDKFNEACRGAVLKYTGEWRKTVRRMGRWVDFDNDYKTMDTDFMESVWNVFKQCWDKGLIYRGYRVQPYSPALATPLSNFETNQGYRDRQDPSLTLIFPLTERENESLLVWTTTPWTLPSNLAIAVGKDIDYVLVEDSNSHSRDLPARQTGDGNPEIKNRFWIAEARVPAYFKNATILKKCKGADLAGLHYEPLFRIADKFASTEEQAKRYQLYVANFVSIEDGAGAVHIAPSFGEEDFELGKEIRLGLFDPLDAEGKFTDKVPQWKGIGAKDADKSIIAFLKEQNRVFKHDTIVHSYPHCYRTGVPLLYRALSTWFMKLDAPVTSANGETKTLKEWMIFCNSQIEWTPDHIKNGRFGKWLEGARDWNLARNRFWGTPIPVWVAEDGETLCVGSIAELKKLSGVELKDLHKHFVDKVEIVKDSSANPDLSADEADGEKNGGLNKTEKKVFKRTSEVFDCWFESGSMPYAQNHLLFDSSSSSQGSEHCNWREGRREKGEGRNDNAFFNTFPADFIAEGLDQTRGWFYTLTVLAAALFQKPAFKNVIVNGIILAEDGSKMSKSKKNYPDPNDLIDRTGADAVRLFLINSAALKGEELRFSEEGVKQIVKSVMLPLWNAVGFFISNHNADSSKGQLKWKPQDKWHSDNELDRWLIAVLQELSAKIEKEMAAYHLYAVVPIVLSFVDDLTNWFVRRSRRRFWKSDNDSDKNFAYATLYKALVDFSKILAPFLPFLSEEIYQILVREVEPNAPLSVHLTNFPTADPALADDNLVRRMSLVRSVIEMGRTLRASKEIKNRQPLKTLTIVPHSGEAKEVAEKMKDLILEELNVEELRFAADDSELAKISAKPNFAGIKAKGTEYAKNMKQISGAISKLNSDEIKGIQNGNAFEIADMPLSITADCLLIVREVAEGLAVEASENYTVALDLKITPELKQSCIARELVNRIQNRRKELDLQITDKILISLKGVSAYADLQTAIERHKTYILEETQGISLLTSATLPASEGTETDWIDAVIEGCEIQVSIKKG